MSFFRWEPLTNSPPFLGFGVIQKQIAPCIIRSFSRTEFFALVNCGWYLDCPKESILALEFSLSEKNEPEVPGSVILFYKHSDTRGEKKGSALGKKKQTEDIQPHQWAESNKEVHLDATLALTIDLNASKHIIDSKAPHPNAPFSSPFGMPSLNFESMC